MIVLAVALPILAADEPVRRRLRLSHSHVQVPASQRCRAVPRQRRAGDCVIISGGSGDARQTFWNSVEFKTEKQPRSQTLSEE